MKKKIIIAQDTTIFVWKTTHTVSLRLCRCKHHRIRYLSAQIHYWKNNTWFYLTDAILKPYSLIYTDLYVCVAVSHVPPMDYTLALGGIQISLTTLGMRRRTSWKSSIWGRLIRFFFTICITHKLFWTEPRIFQNKNDLRNGKMKLRRILNSSLSV